MAGRIIEGDCRVVLAGMEAETVDAVICDPPYELGFMGKAWDASGIAYDPAVWRAVWRVLKPGGHLAAFGGSRTYHRLAVAIEDAGFEIRDQLQWLYGSGFPKSLDVSKAIDKAAGATREVVGATRHPDGNPRAIVRRNTGVHDGGQRLNGIGLDITAPATPDAERWNGWGTALKPAHEPIVLARKPLSERTVAANVLRWGTGALNVDAGRIAGNVPTTQQGVGRDDGTAIFANGRSVRKVARDFTPNAAGRWPANVILSHSLFCVPVGTRRVKGGGGANGSWGTGDTLYEGGWSDTSRDARRDGYRDADGYETVEAWECAPDCPVAMLDAQSGIRTSGGGRKNVNGPYRSARTWNVSATPGQDVVHTPDTGGASRFFYTAKASRRERDAGLADAPITRSDYRPGDPDESSIRTRLHGSRPHANDHPTVKPIALMRYLCRLLCPPGGLIVDPFAGSGTTIIAAAVEGFEALGVELDAHYCAIAAARLDAWLEDAGV